MYSRILLICCVLFLYGCAKRAEAVVPVDIPISAYTNSSCEDLMIELNNEKRKRDALAADQDKAANADALGVFLIGVPTGSLVGANKEGNLAVAKGTVLAIENAIRSKECVT